MKKSFLSILFAAAGLSLLTANTRSLPFVGKDVRTSQAKNVRTFAAPKAESMTWESLPLPFSGEITIDSTNGELADGMYMSRGFEITVASPVVVDFFCSSQWFYFSVYKDKNMDTLMSSGGSMFCRFEKAGTYYLVLDDNAYSLMYGEYLTDRITVFEDHNFENHKAYYSVDYSQELSEENPVSGNIEDTVIMSFGGSTNVIFISDDTAAYFDVEENSTYRIVGTYSVEEGAGLSVAGFYIYPWNFDTAITDVLNGNFIEGYDEIEATLILSSSAAGRLRILPLTFSEGVSSYSLTIEKLVTKTVPQLLDEAQELMVSDMPYYDSADFEAQSMVLVEDGSLIGSTELLGQIYHAVARKVHLNQGNILDITFSHSLMPYVGYLYIYEKDGSVYRKIGEAGYDENDPDYDIFTYPNLIYEAGEEIDLYIIGSTVFLSDTV